MGELLVATNRGQLFLGHARLFYQRHLLPPEEVDDSGPGASS
jgi:hypothetical protein